MNFNQNNNLNQNIKFTIDHLSSNLIPKLKPLIHILNSEQINMKELKKYLSYGIPDQANLIREYAWKVILGFLPKDRNKWREQVQRQEVIYSQFIRQFLHPQKYKDYPIVFDKYNSNRQTKFDKDFSLWQQIQKDTCRTQSQLTFFSTPTQPIQLPFFTSTRRQKYKLISGQDNFNISNLSQQQKKTTYRYDYMTRILFIFARLNPRVEYVQGMNQILAPIFYVVNCLYKDHVQEAACFYMFNNIMTDILELHMKDFGKKQNGIHDRMRNISTMLLALQPKTWQRLQSLKIDPFYYCFRWITLLFSQEFQMYQTLRIWQSILAHDDRTSYINSFALSLIVVSKEIINQKQYGEILSHLKSISQHVIIEDMIVQANNYYGKYQFKDIVILAQKNRKKLEKESHKNRQDNRIVSFFKKIF